MSTKQEKQPGIQMVRGPIKYGSIISISHQQDDLAFLHTYGHINKNLYVRTFRNELQEDQNKISTNSKKQMMPNISNFTNNQQQQQQNQQIQQQQFYQNKKQKEFNRNKQFTQSLFQVFPRLTNAQKNEIIEKKLDINEDIQEEDQIWEDIINENDIKNKIDEQQIKNLQKKLMSEFKDNYDTFMKIKGTNICYNHPIQLLHIESCKFLSCHLQQISKIQSQNYALSLQDYTSEATLFKIIPAFNYQKEGDQVVFSNELIMLIRAIPFHNKTTYLNCSDEVSNLEIKDKSKKQSQNQYPSSPNSKISQFANNNNNAQNNQNFNNSNNQNSNQFSQTQLEQDQNQNQKQIEFKNQYISSKGEMGQDPESQNGKKIIKKREANFSLEESCQWKINLFQNYINPQNQYLLCYNVIWLHHSETSSIILADKSKKSQNQNLSIDFANLYHKDNLEIKTGRSKTGDSFTDYSGETFGMWIIENKNFYLGGHVEQFQPYRLKHLASGLYLSVQVKQQQQNKPGYLTNEHTQTIDFDQRNSNNNKNLKTNKNVNNNNNNINNNEQNNQTQYQLTLSNFPDETTLFQFEPLQKGNSHDETANYIQGNSFVYLKNIYSNGYIQVVNPYGQSVGAKYKKKQGIQLEPSITKECSDDQLFNIYLSNDSIVWEIKYVMQCFQKLVKLIKLLENSERSEKITHRYLKKLQEKVSSATLILKDLDLFLNNMRNNTSLNVNYGIINHFRQKLLQEQYYIDILFRVLEESLNIDEIISWTKFSELKKFHKKDQDTRSVQTDNRSYIDLRNLSVDSHHINRSKNYTLSYILDIKQRNQKRSGSYRNEQSQNNKYLIESIKFSKSINLIYFFFKILIDPKSDNNMLLSAYQFLQAVCRFQNDGVSQNQEIIYNLFCYYENEPEGEQITIPDFFDKQNMLVIDKNSQNLIRKQLFFYSDLALARNFLWSKKLNPKFDMNTLLKNVWPRQINEILSESTKIKSQLAKLAMSLYIDHVHTKKHHQNLELGLANFGNFLTQNVGFSIYNKQVQENEEIEEDETQFSNTKDVDSFQNPLSRGVLMIHNVLQSIHYEDKQIFTSQVNIKMQICDILEQMLDFRQDFLLSNIIYWFTEQIAFTQLQNEDQLQDDNDQQQNNIIEKIKTNTRHILPNISKTGINDIDEKLQQHDEDTGLFGIKKKKTFINFFDHLKDNKNTKNYQKQLEKHKSFIQQQSFKNTSSKNASQIFQNQGKNSGKLDLIQDFIAEDQSDTNLKNQNQIQQKSNLYQINEDQDEEENQSYNIFQQVIPEFYDLDSWLSASYKNVPAEKQPIGSVLPQLLTSFMAVQDEELQKRVLKIDQNLLEMFADIIIREGRQAKFLSIFMSILKCKDKYVFENQLQVLNMFLPLELKEKEKFLLFLEPNKKRDYFKDNSPQNNRKLKKQSSFNTAINAENEDDLNLDQNHINFDFEEAHNFQNNMTKSYNTSEQISLNFKDEPFQYHAKLLDLLIETTYITEKNDYDEVYEDNFDEKYDFNISIAKLRKTFNYSMLLNYLIEEKDDYINDNQFLDPNKTQQNNLISGEPAIDDVIKKQARKKGMSILKPKILDFLRILHVQSEKKQNIQKMDNLQEFRKKLCKFLDKESNLIQSLNGKNINNYQYIDYIFDSLLNFVLCYKKKYIQQQQHDDERIDEKSLHKLSDALSKQINLFEGKITQRQIDRVEYFVNEYVQTDGYNGERFKVEFEGITNLDFRGPLQKSTNKLPNKIQNKFQGLFKNKQVNLNEKLFKQQVTIQNELIPLRNLSSKEDEKNNKITSSLMNSQLEPMSQQQMLQSPIITDAQDIMPILQSQRNSQLQDSPKKSDKQGKKSVLKQKSFRFGNPFQLVGNVTKFITSASQKKEKQIDRQDYKCDQIQEKWNTFVKEFTDENNTQVQQEIQYERHAIANALLNINQLIDDERKQDLEFTIDCKSLISKLILLLQSAVSDKKYKDVVLNLLIILIEMVSKNEDEQEKLQNQFNSYGLTTVVLNVICDTETMDSYIFQQLILLLNTLLQGGNINVQETIYKFFITNKKSEKFFQKIYTFILDEIQKIEQISKQIKNRNRQNSMFSSQISSLFSSDPNLGQIDQDEDNEEKLEEEEKHHLELLQNILSFLQQSVEGHYLPLQKYFKEQTNSINNYDIIFAIIDLIRVFYYDAAIQKYYSVLTQSLETLIEFVQGPCEQNQQAVSESKFLEIAHDLFTNKKKKKKKTGLSSQFFGKQDTNLSSSSSKKKSNISQNNRVRLEKQVEVETWQNNKPAESLTMELYNKYTYAVINKEYEGFQKVFGDNLLGQLASFAQSLFQTGIGYAQKMKKLTIDQLKQQKNLDEEETQKQKSKRKEEKNKMYIDSFNFFAKNTAQIEVNRNEKIELVFFTKLPFSHFISQEQKRNFQDNVNRSTNKTKVEDLLAVSEDYIKQMKHQENLNHFFSHNPLLALLANYDKLWKDLAFLFTIIINIFILTSFSTKFSTDRLYGYHLFQLEEYNTSRTKRYFQGLGLSMAISSGFVVAFFLVKTLPLIVRKVWKKAQQGLLDKLIRWTINLILIIYQVLQELEVMYYLAYGVFAIFGVTLHPLFFTFHLTEILIRYPTLKNIINSVWYPRVQIGLAFLLFIILEYAFSIIGFLFFRDHFQGNCDEMLICFLFYFDWTFKANGGTSGWITDNSEESSQADYVFGRFVWDTFSNYILVIIMINIVSGIIIDSFGDLRDKEYDKVVDITEKCFICGNDKSDFEKQIYSKGFQKHIRIDHYMWNYIFYIGYLEFKDPNDYMGIESYVHQKLKNNDTSWFPFNKSRDVQSLDDEDIQENEILDQCQDDLISTPSKKSQIIYSLKIKSYKQFQQMNKSSHKNLNTLQSAQKMVQNTDNILKKLDNDFKNLKNQKYFENPELANKNFQKRVSRQQSQISQHSIQSSLSKQKQTQKQLESQQKLLQIQSQQQQVDKQLPPMYSISQKQAIDFKNQRSSVLEGATAHKIYTIQQFFHDFLKAENDNENFFQDSDFVMDFECLESKNALALTASNKDLFNHLTCQDIDTPIPETEIADIEQEEIDVEIFQKKAVYPFRFYKNKFQKFSLITDTVIPCLQLPNQKLVPVFSRQQNPNHFWVSLIEKAYAKLHQGYSRLENLDLRTAINDLTGLEPDIINFHSKEQINTENLIKILKLSKNNKSIVGFIRTKPILSQNNQPSLNQQGKITVKANSTLINKMYIFSNIDKNNSLIIKNPWAQTQPLNDSGSAYITISFEDFFLLFDQIVILKDFSKEWRGIKYDPNIIGFIVQEIGERDLGAKILNFQQLKMSYKSDQFSRKFVSGFAQLKKGRYTLVPFCNIQQPKGTYLILEIYYNCKDNLIKFYEKQSKEVILQDATNDMTQTLRKLYDNIDLKNIQQYDLKPLISKEIKQFNLDAIALLPTLYKEFLIKNPNSWLLAMNETQKQLSKVEIPEKSQQQDPLLQNYEFNNIVSILLGEEENEDDEINNTQIQKEQVTEDIVNYVEQESEGVYDFNYYGMGDKGLSAILELLVQEHEIFEIHLSGNNLTDEGILNLCYELEKSHHFELEELDLSDNQITDLGAKTLMTFPSRMKNIVKLNVDQNENFPPILKEKINTFLLKRQNQIDNQ
ncbi:MIR motif [Pseudocohnilembus persalinus]|uniref:MIR motif n=1 Tax=Pseudocohnilembus persalinus TaxID=266149 RepID=A0A0V0R2X6_PSEPJ|nr:MIR motif [Pseudocohnilembus persalinus]|eukprot:KRX08878.1 MIR motif [Pseudocohnilembus persalinus]